MPTLYMMRAEHTLGNHTPLHCNAVATIYRHRLVNAPRGGYMVDAYVLAPTAFYGIIVAIKPISNPDAKVTNDEGVLSRDASIVHHEPWEPLVEQ